jgi:dTDP-4-amino-4,6-dideoxygalactose transaminase
MSTQVSVAGETLAVDGGTPVRTAPFPTWPVWDERDEQGLLEVLRSGTWGAHAGTKVKEFTTRFSAYQEAAHGVCVTNGTAALEVALRAAGVQPFDEVIIPPYTFVATGTAVLSIGAIPVFCDILPETYLIDAADAERRITPRTRAIVAVHIAGQPADLDAVLDVARRHNLKVVEDAAQAHGSRWQGRRPGALADAAAFSFYPGKNLGAYGDGGAVVSPDEALIERIRQLADHGREDKYTHAVPGINSRLDGLQAAVLRVKLRHLDEWNEARRRFAARYTTALRHSGLGLPVVHGEAESVWHLYVVRAPDRRPLMACLASEGIAAGVHYPVPLHRQAAYAHLDVAEGALPVTERAASQVVSLPLYAELPGEALATVVGVVGSLAGAEKW